MLSQCVAKKNPYNDDDDDDDNDGGGDDDDDEDDDEDDEDDDEDDHDDHVVREKEREREREREFDAFDWLVGTWRGSLTNIYWNPPVSYMKKEAQRCLARGNTFASKQMDGGITTTKLPQEGAPSTVPVQLLRWGGILLAG